MTRAQLVGEPVPAALAVTTVGYGALYPVNVTGRLVAVGLMVGGISLLGTVGVTVATWLVDAVVTERVEEAEVAEESEWELVRAELRALREEIGTYRAASSVGGAESSS